MRAITIHKKNCKQPIEKIIEQMNDFTENYAYKYPVFNCLEDCSKCPYEITKERFSFLTAKEKEKYLMHFNAHLICPKNITGNELAKEQKYDLCVDFFDSFRTPFRKEEERIIYTEAFRRLQYKTQVMINSASDDQRTRLLHSLEVQKIARKIAIGLKANYELAETIAIAHDIGHSPFGHAGEYAIKDYLESNLAGSFSHALQGVKVIDNLCSHRSLKPMGLKGLGISDYVLEGVLKHDTDSFSENISSAAYQLQYSCDSLYHPVGIEPNKMYKEHLVYIGGIESQIVCWADKIAYLSHDWEEFVSVGLLETMLSRVNVIIIQMDAFLSNKDNQKFDYSYVSLIEKKFIEDFNKKFEELKGSYYSENYNENVYKDNDFISNLNKLVNCFESSEFKTLIGDNNQVLFSKEQYKCLYAFFKAALSWIRITKTLPPKLNGKLDIIFIINKYLSDTTSHRTVPVLINSLINDSLKRIAELKDRNNLIDYCNREYTSCIDNYGRIDKASVRASFVVNFNDDLVKDINYLLSDFIKNEYIFSTRVSFMSTKASKIVTKLMDFYYGSPQMLPLKYRKLFEQKYNQPSEVNKYMKLLREYYSDLLHSGMSEDSIVRIIESKLGIKNSTGSNTLISIINNDENLIKLSQDAILLRTIADYVSGMTDRMAEKKYNEIESSATNWSKEYSERGIFNI